MRRHRLLAALALALLLAGGAARAQTPVPAPGEAYPTAIIRVYRALDVRMKLSYGDLWMSATKARFDNLRGFMELRYSETLPPSTNADLSGARIYQVLNFAHYFDLNRRKLGLCTLPIKWLAMRDQGGRELRVSLLLIDSVHGGGDQTAVCTAGTFRAPAP